MSESCPTTHLFDLPLVLLQSILHNSKHSRQVCKSLLLACGPLDCTLRPKHYPDSKSFNEELGNARQSNSLAPLDLSHISSRVNDTTLQILPGCYPKLRSLNLTNCVYVSDLGVANLAPCMHTLTHLDLSNCTGLGPNLLASVASLTALCSVHIPDLPQVWSGDKLLHLEPLKQLTLLEVNCTEQRRRGSRHSRPSRHEIFPLLASLTTLRHLSFPLKAWHSDLDNEQHINQLSSLKLLTALIINDALDEQPQKLSRHVVAALRHNTAIKHLLLPEGFVLQPSTTHLQAFAPLQHLRLHTSTAQDTSALLLSLCYLSSLVHLHLPCSYHTLDLQPMTALHSRLTHLSINNFILTHTAAADLAHMTALRALHLAYSHTTGPEDPQLCATLNSLVLLQDLQLVCHEGRPTSSTVSSGWLTALRQLTRLVLADGPEQLPDLDLPVSSIFAHVACAPGLVELQHDCCSGQLDPSFHQVSALTRLTSLKLTGYHSIPPGSLVHLPSCLQRLRLSCCDGVRDEDLRDLAHLGHLTLLALQICNGVSGSGFEVLSHLTDLQELIVEACTGVNEVALRRMPPLPPSVQQVWMPRSLLQSNRGGRILSIQTKNPNVVWHF